MRKKLLSLLTVLCLVLGMLPTTAMAAATEAYEKNEVAQIITTDTEITEDVDGLVLVDAPCTVTVTDAKLSVGIVVSPDAAGAVVELNGSTESAEVVVLAAASVKVAETANAGAVTVDAAEAKLEIAGTAEVALTENATDTTVAVAETATVTVDVAEGATVAIDVAEGAAVAVTAADPEAVTVTGDGAEAVTVTEAEPAEDEDKEDEDKDDEEDKEDEEKKDEEPAEDTGVVNTSAPFVAPVVETKKVKICWSPQGTDDQSDAHSGLHTLNGVTMNAESSKVTSVDAVVQDDGSARGSVNITAANVKEHPNGAESPTAGYWIGFGVELPEKAGGYQEANNTPVSDPPYKYYVIEKKSGETWDVTGASNRVYEVTEVGSEVPTFFNTLYFNIGANAEDPETSEYIVVVTEGSETPAACPTANADTEGSHTEYIEGADAGLALEDSEEIVYIFDVTITAADTTEAESGGGGGGGSGT